MKRARKICQRLTFLRVSKACTNKLYIFRQCTYMYMIYFFHLGISVFLRNLCNKKYCVSDEGYSRNVSCALNFYCTFHHKNCLSMYYEGQGFQTPKKDMEGKLFLDADFYIYVLCIILLRLYLLLLCLSFNLLKIIFSYARRGNFNKIMLFVFFLPF